MVGRRYLQSCQEHRVYLWTLPLCMFRPLLFLALESQSGHSVFGSVRVVVGSLLVHGLCLCSLVAISTWYAAMVVSIRLGFVYLLTYPSRMIRRLFFKTEFWYCVVLVRGTMLLLLYFLRWMLVVMRWFGSLQPVGLTSTLEFCFFLL